ncbi:MAG: hypothetical protein M0Q70_12325 [Dokdonella sp.]|nr:hypothetical protein [Dokdonella sp.]
MASDESAHGGRDWPRSGPAAAADTCAWREASGILCRFSAIATTEFVRQTAMVPVGNLTSA